MPTLNLDSPHRKNSTSFLTIPAPIRTLFDLFPLKYYPPARLPSRSPPASKLPSLWVYITPEELRKEREGKKEGGYSCSPICLKWQAYFRFCGITYRSVKSNEHAVSSSSEGSSRGLPFLMVPVGSMEKEKERKMGIVEREGLWRWVRERRKRLRDRDRWIKEGQGPEEMQEVEEEGDVETGDVQAFLELLETKVRDAWLYTLFLISHNLYNVSLPLYSSSTSFILRPFLASDLRHSAINELKRNRLGSKIDPADIYKEADTALEALSTLLGEEDNWFFGEVEPGLFDAAVFGYIHLILTLDFKEGIVGLKRGVKRRENLMKWWERCVERWEAVV